MKLEHVIRLFLKNGCKKLFAKPLAENDNSKNQVYFGPGFQALNLFPTTITPKELQSGTAIFKAKLNFSWMLDSGSIVEAPGAQLILYPQYPEVRFSGFLCGCSSPPSDLMAGRHTGRILFLAVTDDGRVVGHVVGPDSEAAVEFNSLEQSPDNGVFIELQLPSSPPMEQARCILLCELHRINRLGWIDSKQRSSDGTVRPCNASQCGGFTLEAELGISKNSYSEPDFLGWEVKQHSVSSFARPCTGAPITLMTPEPTGGVYKEEGVETFIRRFGYPDKLGRPDRLNFGGIHRVDEIQNSTGLTMSLSGFNMNTQKITDSNGAVMLLDAEGVIAAAWSFVGLLSHWSRKHSKAVYIPSMSRDLPCRQYSYGDRVRLSIGTDPLKLLSAMATGAVYYDPGIKMENAFSTHPRIKRRSQFRIKSNQIPLLYDRVEQVQL